MLLEAAIRYIDQIPVELVLRDSGLVATNQQNGLSLHIEREGHPPCTVLGMESKFLHVRVLRPLQCVHVRPAELRAKPLQKSAQRENLPADSVGQPRKLGRKFLVETYRPSTFVIMLWNA